jgi:DNA ligase (NAD+)
MKHPGQVVPDSPTGKVPGEAVSGGVLHTVPMLSLDNVFSAEQHTAWAAGLERRLERPARAWSVEPRLDGLAIAARYRPGRGRRHRAPARGVNYARSPAPSGAGTRS